MELYNSKSQTDIVKQFIRIVGNANMNNERYQHVLDITLRYTNNIKGTEQYQLKRERALRNSYTNKEYDMAEQEARSIKIPREIYMRKKCPHTLKNRNISGDEGDSARCV